MVKRPREAISSQSVNLATGFPMPVIPPVKTLWTWTLPRGPFLRLQGAPIGLMSPGACVFFFIIYSPHARQLGGALWLTLTEIILSLVPHGAIISLLIRDQLLCQRTGYAIANILVVTLAFTFWWFEQPLLLQHVN